MLLSKFVLPISIICSLFLLSGCGSSQPHRFYRVDRGWTKAQYNLGMNYLLGQGVHQSDKDAAHAFERAARSANPYAAAQLAYLYAAGRGVHQNNKKALYWYRIAADHGLASAQYNLGIMLANGIGTEQDVAAARIRFQEAVDRGFPPAKEQLKILNKA